ncbi:MAG TPA: phosphoglucosamine mutase, partial [Clostridia bacterium]|nr:phosphoglucosamine mutase [Clostridia bacterium]
VDNEMKGKLKDDMEIQSLSEKVSKELGGAGRVMVRASGTEPLIRVMIEGEDYAFIENRANMIADRIRLKLG